MRVRELPRTDPKPGHVAVAIKTASVNHLDLWLAHGAQRIEPPRIIAADGAGVVHASSDPAWKPGDEVVIYPVACCWECRWCLAGENVRCARLGVIGEHTDGTACELVHVDGETGRVDDLLRSLIAGSRLSGWRLPWLRTLPFR